MCVDVVTTKKIIEWISRNVSTSTGNYICVSNVHMCMEVYDDPVYADIVNSADLIIPDGKPLVWAQRLLGNHDATQVRGYDLTMAVCDWASKSGVRVGFYGGTNAALDEMYRQLIFQYKNLNIVYSYSPPFGSVSDLQSPDAIDDIVGNGVQILFVGLGCPKQEIWMNSIRDKLPCIMIGVGAVFDFISGEKKQAPELFQYFGLEWFYRLLSEPKRLWKRYLYHNPRFVYYFALSLIRYKSNRTL